MPSAQSAAISEYYRQSNASAAQDPPLPLPELRDRDEHWGDLTAEPGGVDYLEVDAGGVRAMWARLGAMASGRVPQLPRTRAPRLRTKPPAVDGAGL